MTSKLITPGTEEWRRALPASTPRVTWHDVATALTPGPDIVPMRADEQPVNPLTRFSAENFGHQNGKHVGGVPGRHGGCDFQIRYAMRGRLSRELLSWRGLTIVHNVKRELEWLITGELDCVAISRTVDPMQTIWIKDHPDFQSVEWPLEMVEFKESRW